MVSEKSVVFICFCLFVVVYSEMNGLGNICCVFSPPQFNQLDIFIDTSKIELPEKNIDNDNNIIVDNVITIEHLV